MRRLIPGWVSPPRLDLTMLALVLVITIAGLAVLYSASGQDAGLVERQAIRIGLGLAGMILISLVPPHVLRIWTPWLFGLGFLLLTATWIFGIGRGTQRWLDLGIIRFQPSELMKLAVPMMVAAFLHPRVLPPGWKDSMIGGMILLAPTFIIMRQPDLGTAFLVAASGGFTLFLAGIRWRIIAIVTVVSVALSPVLWMFMEEFQRNRVRSFLEPEADPLGKGWNIIQSKIAVGSGGLTGKGWLNGTQSQLEFIPERHTDFILAVFAEEFGLFGVCVLLALYLALIGRGLFIAKMARDTYSRLLAGSLAMTLFGYVLVNGAMVSGLLPVVGIPLPLISYGGTSAVSLLVSIGILMSIYSHRNFIK